MIGGILRAPVDLLRTGVFYARHRSEVKEFIRETDGCPDCDGLQVCDEHLAVAYERWFQ